jgi:hydrogenase nickel incorporation protein HypA/HybF
MHEVDMTRALVRSLDQWRRDQPGMPRIRRIVVEVGAFTTVEPDALTFAFGVQRASLPFLQHAELHIKEVPLVAYCEPCATEYRPLIGKAYAHPPCGEPMRIIRSGRELRIAHIETFEEPAYA